jgi:hypothetical protein
MEGMNELMNGLKICFAENVTYFNTLTHFLVPVIIAK